LPDFTPVEIERRNRVRLAVAAYAYEVLNETIMPDAEFDALAMKIEPSMSTGHDVLDRFFMDHFDPFTGIWVHKHPNKPGLHRICVQVHKLKYQKKWTK
jgi:hypothetical protein